MDGRQLQPDAPGDETRDVTASKVAGYFVVVPPGAVYHKDIVADFFRELGRRWLLLVSLTIGGVAAALLLSFLLPRTYRAEVTMVAADAEQSGLAGRLPGGLAGIAALAGVGSEASALTQEALAVLRSVDFTADFIRTNGILPLLFPDEPLAADVKAGEGRGARTDQDGVKVFDEHVRRILVDDDAGVIRLRVYWRDPVLAAQWANDIVLRLNERMRSNAIAESERSLQFLRRALDETPSVEVRQGIFELMRAQMERRMSANVREQYAFRVIDPAIVPDADKYVRPSHLLFGLIGGMGGGCLAILIVMRRRMRGKNGLLRGADVE